MASQMKPAPGMGKFVVQMDYGRGIWVAYRGAKTLELAQKKRRELKNWPAERLRIIENVAGSPVVD